MSYQMPLHFRCSWETEPVRQKLAIFWVGDFNTRGELCSDEISQEDLAELVLILNEGRFHNTFAIAGYSFFTVPNMTVSPYDPQTRLYAVCKNNEFDDECDGINDESIIQHQIACWKEARDSIFAYVEAWLVTKLRANKRKRRRKKY